LEKLKQKLVVDCPDLNTIDAFRLIDLSGKGSVDKKEILQFINSNFQ
jgi:hypothetical protein